MQYICNNCSKMHQHAISYICDCGFVTPLPANTNYFEYFNIPCSFKIDMSNLTHIYQKLVAMYHPDAHVLANESSKINALKHASYINEGFNTLKNNLQRFAYYFLIINHQKIIEDEVLHDSAVAMEFFNLYDKLDSINSLIECKELAKKLQQEEMQLLQPIDQLNFTNKDSAKTIYIRLNYLQKIQQQLQAKQRSIENQ